MKLLRILDRHTGPVISVSVNSVSGDICTLTTKELRIYSINGQILAAASFSDSSSPKPRGRVVLCPPSGEWQDGIGLVLQATLSPAFNPARSTAEGYELADVQRMFTKLA